MCNFIAILVTSRLLDLVYIEFLLYPYRLAYVARQIATCLFSLISLPLEPRWPKLCLLSNHILRSLSLSILYIEWMYHHNRAR